MERGVKDAYFYMQQLDTKLFASNLYWPDRHWSFVMVPDEKRGFEFVTDTAVQIDKRAAAWFFFTYYPKILSDHVGTVYLPRPLIRRGSRSKRARRIGCECQRMYR